MKWQSCNQPSQGAADRNLCDCSAAIRERSADQPRDSGVCAGENFCRSGTRSAPAHFGNGRIRSETATERHQTESPGPRSPPVQRLRPLFFSKLAPYIGGAGSPAMEINDRRNKPFGPGGSTRRLHPSPPLQGGFRRGRTRIDEGVKGEFFPGMVPPLSGYAIVANDNYAPVAQAA
jgi:hypothetical protein